MRDFRKSFFVTISFEAEMLTIMFAPLKASMLPGETGTHISSQISTPITAPFSPQKSMLPNGTSVLQSLTLLHGAVSPDLKWRFS